MAYDLVQSVYMMNAAANGVSSYVNKQEKLQVYLTHFLKGGLDPMGGTFKGFFPLMNADSLIGGDWDVAWGPGVCLQPDMISGQAANAMYVAYSPLQKTYVVAIAATNPASAYDWMSEDADVAAKFMAAWPPVLPFVRPPKELPVGKKHPSPAISVATALGISNLLTAKGMTDPKTGQGLEEFLSKVPASKSWKEDTRIIFTGHSLAGALSPTLAFYLLQNATGKYQKVLKPFSKVLVLPTAGATPGNKDFANLWKESFPQVSTESNTPIKYWNTDIGSELDIVPHAWNQLSGWVDPLRAHTRWGNASPAMHKVLFAAEEAAILRASNGGYENLSQDFLPPKWEIYQWEFDFDKNQWQYPPTRTALRTFTKDNPISSAVDLGDIIVATHVHQYYQLFDVAPAPRMTLSIPAQSENGKKHLEKQF